MAHFSRSGWAHYYTPKLATVVPPKSSRGRMPRVSRLKRPRVPCELQDDRRIQFPRRVNEKERFRELLLLAVLIIIGAHSSAYSFSRGEIQVSKYPLSGKYSRYSSALLPLILFAAGCGGGYSTPPTTPAPSVTLSSSSVTFPATNQGVSSAPMSVTVTNNGTAVLTISSVAAGGGNPGDFTNTNTCTAAVSYLGTCTISVTFVPTAAGPRSETITLTDNAPSSPQVINVSGTANAAIALTLTPPVSAMGVSQTIPFVATGDSAGVTWTIAGSPFLGSPSVITSPGTIDSNGNYTGPGGMSCLYVTVTATSKTDPTVSASATVNVVAPGAFTSTNNVQVAQYAVTPPSPANVSVQFGLDTNYGLNTWTQPNSTLGSPVSLFVAGMKQSTPYHMRGVLAFGDGSSFNDADFTFTTGALTAGTIPAITATTTAGMTPQSGVEVLDLLDLVATTPPLLQALVTDLNGNVIWAYAPGASVPAGATPQPIKVLPNGHFLISWVTAVAGVSTGSVLQEVDLASNVIWSMSSAQLNTALAAATCAECKVTIIGQHHDVAILPNGHFVVLVNRTKTLPDATTPSGDVLIDIGDMDNAGGSNANHLPQPIWVWDEFNHLDTNRRPYLYPDWTHTNAVLYSKDDGNLIISIRHQNWLVKIDYNNGAGSGDILWKMGAVLPTDTTPEDIADFALLNSDGTPDMTATDWFFAQHDPSFVSSNTTGKFSLVLFDNGTDRGAAVVAGGTCGVAGQPACFSTVPLFNIDETAKTATFVIHTNAEDYSFFGGNAEVLKNGNVEYDECNNGSLSGSNATIIETTQDSSSQTVWKMVITGQNSYRGMRMGSLYPGVQW
jgi:arylsulfate sulfotransferase